MVDRMGNWYPDFPGQQPLQDQAFVRAFGIGQQGQAGAQAQTLGQGQALTPPIIHADIVQVDKPEAIDRYPLGIGATQMFITKDEELIVIRTMLQNGQHTDDIYDKRPPAPPAPVFNPSEYVRKDEIPSLLAGMMQQAGGAKEGE